MKKILTLTLLLLLCISVISCSGKNKKIIAERELNIVSLLNDTNSEIDILINDYLTTLKLISENVDNVLPEYLINELNLTDEEFINGLAELINKSGYTSVNESTSDEDLLLLYNLLIFATKNDDELQKFVLTVVQFSHNANGRVERIKTSLSEAETAIKALEEEFPKNNTDELRLYFDTIEKRINNYETPTTYEEFSTWNNELLEMLDSSPYSKTSSTTN